MLKFWEDSGLFLTYKELLEGIRLELAFLLFNLAKVGIEVLNLGLLWLSF